MTTIDNYPEKPRCEICIFMEPGETNLTDITQKQYFCKRLPPTVITVPQQTANGLTMTIQTISAPVSLNNWCGEFDDGQETQTDDGDDEEETAT